MTKTTQSIYQKIFKVMEAINSIEKKGHNDYDNYSYATDADIKTTVRKELIKNKLIFKHDITEEKTRGDIVNGKMNVLVRIKVEYTFTDVETGNTYGGSYYGHGADKGDKGLYKAITGSIKYILTSTFLIPTGDDPEDQKEKEEPFISRPTATVAEPVWVRELKAKAKKAGMKNFKELLEYLNSQKDYKDLQEIPLDRESVEKIIEKL